MRADRKGRAVQRLRPVHGWAASVVGGGHVNVVHLRRWYIALAMLRAHPTKNNNWEYHLIPEEYL